MGLNRRLDTISQHLGRHWYFVWKTRSLQKGNLRKIKAAFKVTNYRVMAQTDPRGRDPVTQIQHVIYSRAHILSSRCTRLTKLLGLRYAGRASRSASIAGRTCAMLTRLTKQSTQLPCFSWTHLRPWAPSRQWSCLGPTERRFQRQ